MIDRPTAAEAPGPNRIAQAEWDRLALAVTDRFAAHLQAASAAVREAEHDLAQARGSLARAEQAAANTRLRAARDGLAVLSEKAQPEPT